METCFSDLFNINFPSVNDETVRVNRVVVPRIQRSYAQGRKGESHIRNTFLSDIFSHLVAGKKMDLNFIYGAIRRYENTNALELIDGQQRITTLFLLHWYIANRELSDWSEDYVDICDKLSKFSYETRVTSSSFCHMLATYKGGLVGMYPSKALRQSKWYFKSYDKDATVESMLVMLDAIHERYETIVASSQETHLFSKLNLLTFNVLSLGQFGLTEELYIKMNSRGLPLSTFDNFKAEMTGYLRSIPIGLEKIASTSSYTGYKVPFYLDFSTNLDIKWIGLFWNKQEPDFDTKYFRFFHTYLGYKYLLSPPEGAPDMRKNSVVKFFLSDDSYSEKYKGFGEYKTIFDAHPEYLRSIHKVLNTLSDRMQNDILPYVNPSWETSRTIKGFFDRSTQNVNMVFFATTEFIEAFDAFNPTIYRQWMRVVWNIVENSETDNFANIASVIRNLSRIIHYIANHVKQGYSFYESLCLYGEEETAHIVSKSIKEEVIKAGRISEDQEWESIFIEAERHPFLKGTTSFYYSDGISKDSFRHRVSIINDLFNDGGTTSQFTSEGHILLRSLLSCVRDWEEIMDKYLTDKVESKKFFKNWLTNTSNIHDYFCDLLDCSDISAVLEKMRNAVNRESNLNDPMQRRIHKTLYTNIKLQNWIQSYGAIRLRWFKGNIYMMKPNSEIYKVMLDTERNRFVPSIIENKYYQYLDSNQQTFWEDTQYYFGNEVTLFKKCPEAEIVIIFTTDSKYIIKVKPYNPFRRTQLLNEFSLNTDKIVDGYIVITDSGSYNVPNPYDDICNLYLNKIENVLQS